MKTTTMTVKQLIKILKRCPEDLRVMVRGHEGGYLDPMISKKTIMYHPEPCCGDYQSVEDLEDTGIKIEQQFKCLVIG
jgi:hypothetical protein